LPLAPARGYGPPVHRLRLNPDVVSRRLDDEVVLVHLGTNQIYRLNATGARFWELAAEGLDERAIAARLRAEFDVGEEQVRGEIASMVERLASEGLVRAE
jgi:hypothetical protein